MGNSVALARANLRRVIARTIEYLSARTTAAGEPAAVSAVNKYQADLEQAFEDWADDACRQLAAEPDPQKRHDLLALLIGLLLVTLIDLANAELPNAIAVGLGGVPGSPEVYAKVAEIMAENANYLKNSLMPDIITQLQNALNDPAVMAAIAAGDVERQASNALRAQVLLLTGRVAQYSGSWWALMNYAVGAQAEKLGQRIRWTRDATAKHCDSCLEFGERVYDSFTDMLDETGGISPADGTDCRGNCRCVLEVVE